MLFVTTPDAETLKQRLTGRGTETQEVILSRLARAVEEARGIELYDYLIINDDLDTAVEQMHALIQSQHFRTANNTDLIAEMRQGLMMFSKGE